VEGCYGGNDDDPAETLAADADVGAAGPNKRAWLESRGSRASMKPCSPQRMIEV
jgi:hypothetical protein